MRTTPRTNAGSMADIAFTLLIFFLVSTTLATDKGQRVRLPEYTECEDSNCDDNSEPISEWNALTLEILPNGKLLLEGKEFNRRQLKDETTTFLLNNGENPNYSDSYQVAVVLILTHEKADYNNYIEVYTHVKAGFNQIRNTASIEQYGQPFSKLTNEQAQSIRKQFPLKIMEQTITE